MSLFKHKKPSYFTTTQIILIMLTGLALGFLVITQARHFTSYVEAEGRDSTQNVFREIQILKTSNDELREEIIVLEKQLVDLSDQAGALESIEKNIVKESIIAGAVDIYGPGIELEIDTDISAIWFTDLYNVLLTSGAEAIAINNIRIVESTAGFDTIPNGQIMVNGVVLNAPYTFSAIGDKQVLVQSLQAPLGIIEKMETSHEEFEYTLVEKDRIEMGKI